MFRKLQRSAERNSRVLCQKPAFFCFLLLYAVASGVMARRWWEQRGVKSGRKKPPKDVPEKEERTKKAEEEVGGNADGRIDPALLFALPTEQRADRKGVKFLPPPIKSRPAGQGATGDQRAHLSALPLGPAMIDGTNAVAASSLPAAARHSARNAPLMRRPSKLCVFCIVCFLILFFRLNFRLPACFDADCWSRKEEVAAEQNGEQRRLPSVLIIGVRKGGTRALIDALALHPRIRVARREVHFFDEDSLYAKGVGWYREQMPLSNSSHITIEKTPAYFTHLKAAQRVYDFDPNVRLLLIVRNPVVRTLSDFTQVQQGRFEKNSSLPAEDFRSVAFLPHGRLNVHYRPVSNSLYHVHLRSWLAFFPFSQFHVVDGDRFVREPLKELRKVEAFLGLDAEIREDQLVFDKRKGFFCFRPRHRRQPRCLGKTKGRPQLQLNETVRALLAANFRPHNEKFFELIGRRFDWKSGASRSLGRCNGVQHRVARLGGPQHARLVAQSRPQRDQELVFVDSYVHVHDWSISGFHKCEDCRYLEASVAVRDNVSDRNDHSFHHSSQQPNGLLEQHPSLMFRIRLHPQGNKESNKDFCFFQIFPMGNLNRFKAKFHVFNSKNEEIATTVYAGTQQLNGYFEYVRRDALLTHIAEDDELRVQVHISAFTDISTRSGTISDDPPEAIKQDDVTQDLEKSFNDERFADFRIICGEGVDQRVFYVHRVILSARSQYFSALLAPHTKESEEGKLELPDVDYETFNELLLFLYTGRAPAMNKKKVALVAEILGLADRFQMSMLKEQAAKILRQSMKKENVCTTLVIADLHCANELKDAALEFMSQNLSDSDQSEFFPLFLEVISSVQTPEWENLLIERPRLVNEVLMSFSATDELSRSFLLPDGHHSLLLSGFEVPIPAKTERETRDVPLPPVISIILFVVQSEVSAVVRSLFSRTFCPPARSPRAARWAAGTKCGERVCLRLFAAARPARLIAARRRLGDQWPLRAFGSSLHFFRAFLPSVHSSRICRPLVQSREMLAVKIGRVPVGLRVCTTSQVAHASAAAAKKPTDDLTAVPEEREADRRVQVVRHEPLPRFVLSKPLVPFLSLFRPHRPRPSLPLPAGLERGSPRNAEDAARADGQVPRGGERSLQERREGRHPDGAAEEVRGARRLRSEGAGLNNTQMARLAELVGSHDLGLGVVMGAHQSIGYKGILLFGTEAQKKKYLPDVATGRKFAAFCLTEPSSGSDANSIRSSAKKSADGKHYILNGGKIWISNGGFRGRLHRLRPGASLLPFLFFIHCPRSDARPPARRHDQGQGLRVHRRAGLRRRDQRAAREEDGHQGLEHGGGPLREREDPRGEPARRGGRGLQGRDEHPQQRQSRFGIPAAMTGAMRFCIGKAVDHVTSRVQFGKKLMEFGKRPREGQRHGAAALRHGKRPLHARLEHGPQRARLPAGGGHRQRSWLRFVPAFLFERPVGLQENAWQVCDDAIQLLGGNGFMREMELERVQRDLRIFRIFEGANDVMRLFVSLTGMQFAGKHLQQVAKEIKAGGISTLFGEVKRRAFGSSDADFTAAVHPSLKDAASLLNSNVGVFGKTVEALLAHHRKGIIDRQYELIRIANAAIDIYALVCVLSRATYSLQKDANAAQNDLQIAQLFARNATQRIQQNLKDAANAKEGDLKKIDGIAARAFEAGGIAHRHPIDV
ncbi:Acyl-CoA dehydrogenase family member 9 [Aphelenchoides fujianensis]|nr:Acyl-CoA dehydrogenase family member 9 [Aphelenchoides fujianensis]